MTTPSQSFNNTQAIEVATVRLHDGRKSFGAVSVSDMDYFASDEDDMENLRRRLEETFGFIYDCEATVVFDFETGE